MQEINYVELFSIISNIAILIPFGVAVAWHRVLRSCWYFTETWVSMVYHMCRGLSVCMLSYVSLKNADYFFAQGFIPLTGLYLVHWEAKWIWLEWVLAFFSFFVIAVLQATLPGELYVQAVICVAVFLCIFAYWIIYASMNNGKLPPYDWFYLGIGLMLTGASVVLFVSQELWPDFAWFSHSMWHISASLGQAYILMIKKPAQKFAPVASKVSAELLPIGSKDKLKHKRTWTSMFYRMLAA